MAKWQSTLEMLEMTPGFWHGKRVFLTGHTGFKGGWLSLWLQSMGAEVHGYALAPPTEPNFFSVADVEKAVTSSIIADICDYEMLLASLQATQPDIVFHLAAQPLVIHGYQNPLETFRTNIMGTVHLLEAARATRKVKAVVNITSDKCYKDNERRQGYRENEPMGGRDPYSSSKGCSELVTAAYRESFLRTSGIAIATARAGNVIGGGDWAMDRLLPDFLRAIDSGSALTIRSPNAIRPWQHVLEPLFGYLTLAEKLYTQGPAYSEPWNFGPAIDDSKTVDWIIRHLASKIPGLIWNYDALPQSHEALFLRLDSRKSRTRLKWRPRWTLPTALNRTLEWHHAWKAGQDMNAITLAQIDQYLNTSEMGGDCGAV